MKNIYTIRVSIYVCFEVKMCYEIIHIIFTQCREVFYSYLNIYKFTCKINVFGSYEQCMYDFCVSGHTDSG